MGIISEKRFTDKPSSVGVVTDVFIMKNRVFNKIMTEANHIAVDAILDIMGANPDLPTSSTHLLNKGITTKSQLTTIIGHATKLIAHHFKNKLIIILYLSVLFPLLYLELVFKSNNFSAGIKKPTTQSGLIVRQRLKILPLLQERPLKGLAR